MTRKNIIIKNTLSNIGMQVIVSLVPLILLPFMLRYWGKDVYGILILVYSAQLLMNFLNQAIQMTLMKYVSEAHALQDTRRLNAIVNDFWLVAFLNNFIVSLCLILLGLFGLQWLNIPAHLMNTARDIFIIVGISGIIVGAFIAQNGILVGLQKIHENNLFRIVETILTTIAAVWVLMTRQSLETYVICISIAPVLVRIAQFFYVKRLLPEIRLNPLRYFDFNEFKVLMRFSGFQIANQVADTLMYTADKFIIQRIMGPGSVTMYEVANKPNLLFQNFVSLPLSAIMPACSAAYAKNDHIFLNKVLIQGTRIYLLLVLPCIFVFMISMKQFLRLWVGVEYISVAFGAQLFLLTYFIASPFKVFSHMMLSKARVQEYAMTKIIYAILNVPLSIFFIYHMGIIGGILVTVMYWVIVYPLTNVYVFNKESMDFVGFIKTTLPIYLSLIPLYFFVKVTINLFSQQSIILLMAYMGVVCAAYLILGYKFLLNPEEKQLIKFPKFA